MRNTFLPFALPLLLLLAFPSHASVVTTDPDFETLIEMPINDLMNIVVSVASLENESLLESPAIVSSFNRKDMQSMGLRSLKDILSFFPGFIVNEPLSGSPVVQIRGLMDSNNQKILFLIDDTPYWIAATGNIPVLGIPFDLIEKVEVIRGPGSVIYGTNASAGVIKIVTRKDNVNDVNISIGEFKTANVSGYQKWSHGDNPANFTRLAYELQVADGYSASIENALTGPPGMSPTENGKIPRSEETRSVYLNHQRNNFSGFLHAAKTEKSGASLGSIRSKSIYRENTLMFHADYTFGQSDNTTKIFADYNNYYSTIEINDMLILWGIPGDGEFAYDNDGNDNYRMRGGFQTRLKLAAEHFLLIGAEHEKRATGDYLLLDDNNGNNLNAVPTPGFSTTPGYNGVLIHGADEAEESTVYAQTSSHLGDYRLLFGLRYVDNEKSGNKFIPRLSAVYQIDDTQSLKLLYAVGFNSPTFRQNADVGAFGASTNTNLEAERIHSYDLAYSYTSNGQLFVANIFHILAEDIIDSVNGSFVNTDEFERSGVELDYQLTHKHWMMYSNVSYLKQGEDMNPNDLTAAYAPTWNLSLGGNYRIIRPHCLGASIRYVGERINSGGHSLVNMDYQFKQKNYTLFATLVNVLDKHVLHPDVRTIGTTDIRVQAYPERSAFVGIEYRY